MTNWKQRAARRALDTPGKVIEFVPGGKDGERAYFWIGDRQGNHYADISALTLVAWIESRKEQTP